MSYFERLENLMSKEMRRAYSMSNINIPPKAMLFHTNPIHLSVGGKLRFFSQLQNYIFHPAESELVKLDQVDL